MHAGHLQITSHTCSRLQLSAFAPTVDKIFPGFVLFTLAVFCTQRRRQTRVGWALLQLLFLWCFLSRIAAPHAWYWIWIWIFKRQKRSITTRNYGLDQNIPKSKAKVRQSFPFFSLWSEKYGQRVMISCQMDLFFYFFKKIKLLRIEAAAGVLKIMTSLSQRGRR